MDLSESTDSYYEAFSLKSNLFEQQFFTTVRLLDSPTVLRVLVEIAKLFEPFPELDSYMPYAIGLLLFDYLCSHLFDWDLGFSLRLLIRRNH